MGALIKIGGKILKELCEQYNYRLVIVNCYADDFSKLLKKYRSEYTVNADIALNYLGNLYNDKKFNSLDGDTVYNYVNSYKKSDDDSMIKLLRKFEF